MARIRTVKPEFWGDEKLSPMPALDRLVFLGLISMADDAGRLVDNVKTIDGFIFPGTDETARDSLDSLARCGRIVRYKSASGQRLIQIANWKRHQKVDNPAKYVLPGPDEEGATVERGPSENEPSLSRSDLRPTTNDPLPTTSEQRESAGGGAEIVETAARATFGTEFGVVEEFLATRKASSRTQWLREMLRLVSPGSQYIPEDVIGACRDATIEGLQQGAHGFRSFVEKHRQARMRAHDDGPPSRHRASQPGILSASDAFVDKILELVESGPPSGQGVPTFIRKEKVRALGEQVFAAYEKVGGSAAFCSAREHPTEKLHFLRRDFAAAFARAINAKPVSAHAEAS